MVIQGKKIWFGNMFREAALHIEEGKIKRISHYGDENADEDYHDKRVVPGFIDMHTHGAYGVDTNDASYDGVKTWIRKIPEEGVTSMLPTTVTQSEDILLSALKNIARIVKDGYEGAEMLGIHLEGPFISRKYKGAQPEEWIREPDVSIFKRYQAAANGLIKVLTLAPEEDKEFALIRYASGHGVVVSIGHTDASYEQAVMAIANGASSMTHFYNGMKGFNHREPGTVGAGFRFHDVYGEIICDGCHSHLSAIHDFFRLKREGFGIMVSDSLCAKGCSGGHYQLGGQDYEIYQDGSAHLSSNGSLAGSTLKINKGLQLLVEEAQVPFGTVLDSCTLNPARCLNVGRRKGKLSAGYDADIVVLDSDYSVIDTYCRGKRS